MISGILILILIDWVYVLYPRVEVYRARYTEIVSIIRKGMREVYLKGKDIEDKWVINEDIN